jgi:outer membrane protein TolC
VNYLKSKVSVIDKKREIKAIYEQVMQNIENLEKKKQLSVENKDLYNSLLKDTKEQFRAGYKASFDVELLQNSLNIEELNVDIYEIDKQLELLTLYEMYKNEI